MDHNFEFSGIVFGQKINLRLVKEDDAEFIVDLRTKKGFQLSVIDGNVESQKNWIRNYQDREQQKKEFYFVIETKEKEPLGVVRVYDITERTFSWGSWIIKDGAPILAAIETVLLVYDFSFFGLELSEANFDVKKENETVLKFHKMFGAKQVGENEKSYLFSMTSRDYIDVKSKFSRLFNNPKIIEKCPQGMNIFDY